MPHSANRIAATGMGKGPIVGIDESDKAEEDASAGWLEGFWKVCRGSSVDVLIFVGDAPTAVWRLFYVFLTTVLTAFTVLAATQAVVKYFALPTSTEVLPVTSAELHLPNSTICFPLLLPPLLQSSANNVSWSAAEPILLELLRAKSSHQLFETDCPWIRETSCVDACGNCTHEQCNVNHGLVYRGKRNVTVTGHICQNWLSNKPHEIKLKLHAMDLEKDDLFYGSVSEFLTNMPQESQFLDLGDHNYCRVVYNNDKQPWCYTTDPDVMFDPCFESCAEKDKAAEPCVNEEASCVDYQNSKCHSPMAYDGNYSTTIGGRTCQRWSALSPHHHSFTYYGDHNYCRNPDGEAGPWCYTTDPTLRWQLCFKPCDSAPCVTEGCARMGSGPCVNEFFETNDTMTRTGRACQAWSSQSPHGHSNAIGDHNFCRNPDAENGPWCYTTDPLNRWEYCYDDCPDIQPGRILLATSAALIELLWYFNRYVVNPRVEVERYEAIRGINMQGVADSDSEAKWRMVEAVREHYLRGQPKTDYTALIRQFQKELCRAAGLHIRFWSSEVKRQQRFVCEEEWMNNAGVYLSDLHSELACYHLPLSNMASFTMMSQRLEIGLKLGIIYPDAKLFDKELASTRNLAKKGRSPISMANN